MSGVGYHYDKLTRTHHIIVHDHEVAALGPLRNTVVRGVATLAAVRIAEEQEATVKASVRYDMLQKRLKYFRRRYGLEYAPVPAAP